MDDEPTSIGDGLARVARHLGMGSVSVLQQVIAVWPDVAGALAEHSEPTVIRDGRLVVVTGDPAVAEALRWRAATLVGAVVDRVGPGAGITSIEVRVSR